MSSKEDFANDIRSFYDSKWLQPFDLQGQAVTLTIESVRGEKVKGKGGEEKLRAIVKFAGKTKEWIPSKTCAKKVIPSMYSHDVRNWVGKKVTIFPTTCEAFGEANVPCIRVKPGIPADRKEAP